MSVLPFFYREHLLYHGCGHLNLRKQVNNLYHRNMFLTRCCWSFNVDSRVLFMTVHRRHSRTWTGRRTRQGDHWDLQTSTLGERKRGFASPSFLLHLLMHFKSLITVHVEYGMLGWMPTPFSRIPITLLVTWYNAYHIDKKDTYRAPE